MKSDEVLEEKTDQELIILWDEVQYLYKNGQTPENSKLQEIRMIVFKEFGIQSIDHVCNLVCEEISRRWVLENR